MVGLYLYGAMRRTYCSRRLAELCQRDVVCIYGRYHRDEPPDAEALIPPLTAP